jgi:release factor glutamine methyltransferase
MVYSSQEDSYLLLEQVKKLAHGRVLDMGTGSGIQAVGAAEKDEVKEVIAVDIDDEAVRQVRNLNNSKIKVFNSDLFLEVGGSFDTIIFNPPYLPEDENDDDDALDGGKKGFELIARFLHQAKDYLNKDGFILIVFSNRTGREAVDEVLMREGFSHELLDKKSLAFFEELYVYRIYQ